METKFSVLFWGKKNITKNNKLLTIYLRVTVSDGRFELSTNRVIESAKWSADAGKMKGNSDEAKSINSYLDTLKHKAYQFQKELILEEKLLNKKTFRDKWLGIKEKPRLLLQILSDPIRLKQQRFFLVEVKDGCIDLSNPLGDRRRLRTKIFRHAGNADSFFAIKEFSFDEPVQQRIVRPCLLMSKYFTPCRHFGKTIQNLFRAGFLHFFLFWGPGSSKARLAEFGKCCFRQLEPVGERKTLRRECNNSRFN